MSKTALVLGGTGDIGQAIVNSLHESNYVVTAVGSKDLDLTRKESVESFISKKSFDILIHSAGVNVIGPFEQRSVTDIELAIQANLMGFLQIVHKLIPYWKQNNYGRIVVISSLYGFTARKGRIPYVISKHALLGAVKTLALELAPYGVITNAVSPGYIQTKMTTKNNSTETIKQLIQGIPQARLGTPEDIAKIVNFLITTNSYINGQDIIADGGYSAGGFQG
jgi:3-oxoacyl-[acyl-carrier protein] reductase